MAQQNGQWIRVGGLWKTRGGHLSGSIFNGAKLLILPNQRKESDRHPDFVVWLVPPEPREEADRGYENQDPGYPAEGPSVQTGGAEDDSDLPF